MMGTREFFLLKEFKPGFPVNHDTNRGVENMAANNM
jgi:hypothetical protein